MYNDCAIGWIMKNKGRFQLLQQVQLPAPSEDSEFNVILFCDVEFTLSGCFSSVYTITWSKKKFAQHGLANFSLTSPSILSASEVNDSEMATFSHALVSKNGILCWRASYKIPRPPKMLHVTQLIVTTFSPLLTVTCRWLCRSTLFPTRTSLTSSTAFWTNC